MVIFLDFLIGGKWYLVMEIDKFEKTWKSPEKNFITMLEFYAPSCGQCNALAPEYEAAAIELQSREGGKRLAKVNSQFWGYNL